MTTYHKVLTMSTCININEKNSYFLNKRLTLEFSKKQFLLKNGYNDNIK